MRRWLPILAALCTRAQAAPSSELTMADLQALDKAQSWTELLDSADRVKPSARTPDWNKLVTSAATHVIDQIDHESESGLRTAEKLIAAIPAAEHKYTFIKSDKGYIAHKATLVGRIANAGGFIEELADGIDKFPPGVAKKIALIVSEEKFPSETIHYWALAADDDKEACGDGRLEAAVVNVLRGGGGSKVADAQRAAGTCYSELEASLVKELDAAKPKDQFIANACPVMKAHGAKTVVKKKCP